MVRCSRAGVCGVYKHVSILRPTFQRARPPSFVTTPRGNNLVVLGSAAVLIVYAAGFAKTKPAADRMAAENAVRRPRSASRSGTGAAGARTAVGESGAFTVSALSASSAVELPAASPVANPGAVATPAVTTTVVKTSLVSPSASAQVTTTQAALPPTGTTLASASPAVAPPTAVPPTVVLPAAVPLTAVAQAATSSAPMQSAPVSTPAPTLTAPAPAPAPASTPPTAAPAAAPVVKSVAKTSYKDGVYLGRGTSRHGDIEAMVEIQNGRITNTVISQCLTRYSCSWIAVLLPQVVARQSAEVDYVSGATVSSDAFYYAVMQALAQAK